MRYCIREILKRTEISEEILKSKNMDGFKEEIADAIAVREEQGSIREAVRKVWKYTKNSMKEKG